MTSASHALAVIIAALAVLVFCSIRIDAAKVWNDVENCGKYKHECPKAPAHSDRTCTKGKCGYKCKGSWRDCDYSKRNGCETNVECDSRNCGECGKRCPVPANSKATCSRGGKCGFECKRGFKLSNNACVNATPPATCTGCTPPDSNTDAVCRDGTCEFHCHEGFQKCNADGAGTVCVNVKTDLNNCGSCGNVCRLPANSTQSIGAVDVPTCSNGTCELVCGDPRRGNCDGLLSNGCEANLYTGTGFNNCGRCGNICPDPVAPNTRGTKCVRGQCEWLQCEDGFLTCDGILTNGCETACILPSNTIGPTCPLSPGGQCGWTSCVYGTADCDGVATNGCERDLRWLFMDPIDNCGVCINDSDCGQRPNQYPSPFSVCDTSIGFCVKPQTEVPQKKAISD